MTAARLRTPCIPRLIALRLGGALIAVLAALSATAPVLADEGHHHGAEGAGTGAAPLIWGVTALTGVFALLLAARQLLARRKALQSAGAEGQGGYFAAVRQFSRNARLFLTYSLLAGLGTGIWTVLFNLYLLRVGFSVGFVGTFWLVNMLCHAAGALPAGLIADRFGRRRAFFIATGISLVAQGSLLFTQQPAAILALAGVAGCGEAFHGVTGAPFMMENSEPRERPHLFSLNACFLQVSYVGGSVAGGLLPLAWAAVIGLDRLDPTAARWALVTGLPLTMLALAPLAFMHERSVELVESFRDLVTLRNVVHAGLIARLTLLSLMVGTGFGLTVRFFNLFFEEAHDASDSQVGTVLALGALASAAAILMSPTLAQHWGKAKGILITQSLSVPWLLLMAAAPSLSAATVFFLVRGATYSIGQPLRNQLSMEFISARERGTTAGFTHTAFDAGGGVGAGMAGFLISQGGFAPVFVVAAGLILVPAVCYYLFFAALEGRRRATTLVPAAAGGS
jgi:MFS family permease